MKDFINSHGGSDPRTGLPLCECDRCEMQFEDHMNKPSEWIDDPARNETGHCPILIVE